MMESDSRGERRREAWAQAVGRRLAAALLLAALALAPMLWAALRIQSDAGTLKHTYQVLETLYSARAAMRQATTALHAYLNTGEQALIPQYQTAVHAAWREAWRFKELTVDNPKQIEGAKVLEQQL